MTPNTGARTPKSHEIAQPLVTQWLVVEDEVALNASMATQAAACVSYRGAGATDVGTT